MGRASRSKRRRRLVVPAAIVVIALVLVMEGPDVINGDGDRTGFSVVKAGSHQLRADAGHGQGAPLAGYVSPD